ncbi:MAG: hypothetical protein GTO02_22580, partial [Candidatus Dadabacteria bacterium]|nr:hypothetical protein [Candidatus Dadabacteria bacterium]NIQ17066.1 hypothetical protein [Candidatus Dadabacteria bacterium]
MNAGIIILILLGFLIIVGLGIGLTVWYIEDEKKKNKEKGGNGPTGPTGITGISPCNINGVTGATGVTGITGGRLNIYNVQQPFQSEGKVLRLTAAPLPGGTEAQALISFQENLPYTWISKSEGGTG